ncbi:MAG: hypothetical protein RMJ98_14915 [Myxococcales bacterium]|nr:hypothetical protein [Polyangiaceae bacterium]MDW8250584.1 hypothetical protein [Myxococcales bacterium]
MPSRWRMQEVHTGSNDELGQVQYVFLELGKLKEEEAKKSRAAAWAWLFVKAPELGEFPLEVEVTDERRAHLARLDLAGLRGTACWAQG